MEKTYEIMLILKKGAAVAEKGEFFKKFNELLKEVGGEATKEDFWGSRKFSYPIKKLEEGIYTVIKFTCPASKVEALEKKLRLESGVVRYLITNPS